MDEQRAQNMLQSPLQGVGGSSSPSGGVEGASGYLKYNPLVRYGLDYYAGKQPPADPDTIAEADIAALFTP